MGMKACLRLLVATMLFAVPATSHVAAQQTWPRRTVRIIVPFPAGGSNDTLCRIVAEKLALEWKQSVVVDNEAGGGGNAGAEMAYTSPGDGYTLLCSAPGPLSINHNLYRTLPFDWSRFVPATVLALTPNVITARRDLPANTAQELIDLAKANPGKVTYASQGNGSTSHLSGAMLATIAGIKLVHVPYKGEAPALAEIAAGRVDIFIGTLSAALRFEKSGQVKFLGLAARKRSPIAPKVPDAAEIGLPDLISSAWFAIVAPPGTPDAVVQKINQDSAIALTRGDVRAKFLEQGAEPVGGTTAGTVAFIREEEIRWRSVIKSANVTLQ